MSLHKEDSLRNIFCEQLLREILMSRKHKAAKRLATKKAPNDHNSKATELEIIRGDLRIHAWQNIALGLAILVITILATILLTK